tara:strand:+ start:1019 stop:1795 length:777 start_codon:yes stop_codon:yes gene_type:complete
MKDKLKIILVQNNLFWKDKQANLLNIEHQLSSIKEADIILLPEMFSTAFCPAHNYLAEPMSGDTVKWMLKIAKQKKSAISGTLMIKDGDKLFNRLVWISKKGLIYTYDKRHLFSLINEDKYFQKGKKRLIIEIDDWKICPLICYDLRFPVFSRNNIEYDVLIYLANWPIKRIDAWDTLLKARAIENQAYTIGVNRVGKDGNDVIFNGHSKVFDAFGVEILSSNENKQEVLACEISLGDLRLKRRQMNFLKDRDNFRLF